jgi:hypothetical protein
MADHQSGRTGGGHTPGERGTPGRRPSATGLDDTLAQYCKLAIASAGEELGVEPLALARRLNQGEIARLVHLLNAAFRHVENAGLRHRIEDLLMAITDGAMPAARPESELDWALRVARGRREAGGPSEEPSDEDLPEEPGNLG